MAWLLLLVAGVLEIGWAIGLKYSQGFSQFWPSVWTLAAMGLSFYLLSLSLKTLPVGTAYAVWTGIGAAGTAVLGMILFKESTEFLRIFFLFLIVVAILGLKFTST